MAARTFQVACRRCGRQIREKTLARAAAARREHEATHPHGGPARPSTLMKGAS